MKRILVPIDFSSNSKSALQYALKLAAVRKATVDVLYVYSLFDASPERILGQAKPKLIDPATKAFNDVKRLVDGANKSTKVRTKIHIKNGIPEVKITETAVIQKSELIVMGQTGNNALQRFFIGSTVANVINEGVAPVLVVPEKAKWKKIKRVVFTTDLSNDTLKHAEEAAEFARYFDSELVFLYVDTGSALISDEKALEMTQKLKTKIKYNKVVGFICEDITVREGIDYYFSHYKADMVVMVTRHHHFPQIIWSRSLTKRLSAAFHIPMLALVEKK